MNNYEHEQNTDLLKHIIFCHVLKLAPGAGYVGPIRQLREGRVQS